MNGPYLLDTNIAIAVLEADRSITKRIDPETHYFLPSVAAGELFYGAFKSGRIQHNLDRVQTFLKRIPVLPCNASTAECYGELKAQLKKKGRPIPDNDIWIAAIAQEQDMTVVTRDIHFQEIDLIKVVVW